MKKVAIILFLLVLSSSCEVQDLVLTQDDFQEPPPRPESYSLHIDSVLTENGVKSVPKDVNGFYHIKLVTKGAQQFHRITGRILISGKEPKISEKVNWESNLYWTMTRGTAFATITKTYINYFTGQFTTVQLPPLVSNKDEIVPTVNFASYSSLGGRVNTIISPIMEMKGDTMIVKATNPGLLKPVYTKIVLD